MEVTVPPSSLCWCGRPVIVVVFDVRVGEVVVHSAIVVVIFTMAFIGVALMSCCRGHPVIIIVDVRGRGWSGGGHGAVAIVVLAWMHWRRRCERVGVEWWWVVVVMVPSPSSCWSGHIGIVVIFAMALAMSVASTSCWHAVLVLVIVFVVLVIVVPVWVPCHRHCLRHRIGG